MADEPTKPTQAEIDAEEAKAKGKFQEWFTESMTAWDKKKTEEAEAEAKRNPPKNQSSGGSSETRRVNALQKLLNL